MIVQLLTNVCTTYEQTLYKHCANIAKGGGESLKDKHRSKKLDSLLGQKVTIIFHDGQIKQGVLMWNDELIKPPFYLSNQGYYLEMSTCFFGFTKSVVKKIEKYRG